MSFDLPAWNLNMALNMVLQVKEDWIQFFITAGIPDDAANNYATTLVENRTTESLLPQLDHQFLTQLSLYVSLRFCI